MGLPKGVFALKADRTSHLGLNAIRLNHTRTTAVGSFIALEPVQTSHRSSAVIVIRCWIHVERCVPHPHHTLPFVGTMEPSSSRSRPSRTPVPGPASSSPSRDSGEAGGFLGRLPRHRLESARALPAVQDAHR